MLTPEQFEVDVKEFIAECQSNPVLDLSKDDPCKGCRFEDFCDRFYPGDGSTWHWQVYKRDEQMVYITGDIHGDFNRFLELGKFCHKHNLGKNDWIICLGDVGLNYYGKDDPREWSIKTIAADIPVNLFCIHGNHERRPSRKDGYKIKEISGDICGKVWHDSHYPNQCFAIDGEVYQILTDREVLNCLVCGGAYSVDKYYRLELGYNWWPNEQPNEKTKKKIWNITHDPQIDDIDVMLTHTCPFRFIPTELFIGGIDQSTVDQSTEIFFDNIYECYPNDCKPFWYFGHFHGNKYTDDYVMLFDDVIKFGDKVKTND